MLVVLVQFRINSTFIAFRFEEVKKVLKIRVVPQGPFYVTISSTKGCLQKIKKVNFGTLAQKGGGGQSKIPNVDQY